MSTSELIGYCAATLATMSFAPQAWPIVAANAVTPALAVAILAMKLRYR